MEDTITSNTDPFEVKLNKAKASPTKNPIQELRGKFRNILTQSSLVFELDWLDMETKSRGLIIETLQPTLLKVHQQKDDIVAMQRQITAMQKQIKDLEYTVLQKGEKLTVFEEIHERITLIEKLRAENESSIQWEIESIKKGNRDQQFDNDNKKRQIESLDRNREMMEQEMQRMKTEYAASKEEFMRVMKGEHNKMIDNIDDLRKIIDKQEMQLTITTAKSISNYNYIMELQNRSQELHKNMEKCQRQVTLIQELKQDRSVVEDAIGLIWQAIHKGEVEMDQKTNQFNTVENFVEKYIPIRIQSQISETLGQVLPRAQLNKLENYEMEKFNELNMKILEDDGSANLASIMREILKEVIAEQEGAKRKGLIRGGGTG